MRTVWFHLTSFLSHAAVSPHGVKAKRMNLLQDALNIEVIQKCYQGMQEII